VEGADGRRIDPAFSAAQDASRSTTLSVAWRQLAELIPFPNRTTEQRQAYTTDPATVKLIRPVIDTIAAKESEGIGQLRKIVEKAG